MAAPCARSAVGSSGAIYAGGDFTSPAAGLARYSSGTWSAVGGGIYNNNADVYALLAVGSDLYVGGSFLNVGASDGLPAANLARWDGTNWYTVGSSPPLSAQQYVDALATSEGNLYVANRDVAAGGFHFYQVTDPAGSATAWNQLAYSTNCADTLNDCDRVYAVAASQNNVFIGGTFTNGNATFSPALSATTSSTAWWNRKANTWSAMDGGVTAPVNGAVPGWMQGVHAFAMDRSSLYAGGEFMTAKGSTVAAARASRWSQPIADLALLGSVSPVGTVYVGDQITYNLTVENLGYVQATGPTIYATLPTGVTFVSASGCTQSSGVVTCNLSSINVGASTTKAIVVQRADDRHRRYGLQLQRQRQGEPVRSDPGQPVLRQQPGDIHEHRAGEGGADAGDDRPGFGGRQHSSHLPDDGRQHRPVYGAWRHPGRHAASRRRVHGGIERLHLQLVHR